GRVACAGRAPGTSPSWSRLLLDVAGETVPLAMRGQDVHGALGIALEFLAQSQDMRVHRPGRRKLIIAPDLVEQAIPRDHLSLVLHEIAQEIELLAGELDLATCLVDLAPAQAHSHVAEGELLELLPRPGPPQHGADPCEELAQAKGLGDVVVR